MPRVYLVLSFLAGSLFSLTPLLGAGVAGVGDKFGRWRASPGPVLNITSYFRCSIYSWVTATLLS